MRILQFKRYIVHCLNDCGTFPYVKITKKKVSRNQLFCRHFTRMESWGSWATFIIKNREKLEGNKGENTQERALDVDLLFMEGTFLFTRTPDFVNIIVR